MDEFNVVVAEVLLVDAVQALDVCVTLGLECVPVEGGRFGEREAVSLGLLERFGQCCRVPGDLLGNAAGMT